MLIETGKPFYGQNIGILVFSTITPRIPGDAGHSQTFNYPVRYEVVKGGFADLINGGEEIKNHLITATKNLKAAGIRAVVGDCGLMSLYQDILGSKSDIPVAASSLCQISMIWELIGRKGSIGILTGHSDLLKKEHLLNSGWREDIKIKLQGLQDEEHFSHIVIEGNLDLDVDLMRRDILNATEKLILSTPDLKAIVFECSNIASFSKDIFEKYKIPVFDVISAANLLEYSVNPPKFI